MPNQKKKKAPKPEPIHQITLILPTKPKIEYKNTTMTFRTVQERLEQIQKEMLNTFQKDMKVIDNFKEQRSLHSVEFYWWLLGSYSVMQAEMLNLLSECSGLASLCMEVEKRLAYGVPVNVQVDVPQEIEKEMKLWLCERESARKAQREYIG